MDEYGIRKDPRYELIASREICHSEVVRVCRERIRLPHGHVTEQDIIYLPEAVAIVPILEEPGGHRAVVLVEQFRNSVRGYMHEIPAGMVDAGEELDACARRELEEETGYRAGRITYLASLLALPGSSRHRLHFFLAEDLSPGRQQLDVSECLQVRLFSLDQLVTELASEPPGSTVVVDGKTHLGLLHTALYLAARDGKANRKEPRP